VISRRRLSLKWGFTTQITLLCPNAIFSPVPSQTLPFRRSSQ
jgi:hypothetical protein